MASAQRIAVLLIIASLSPFLHGANQPDCRQRTVIVNVLDEHGFPVRDWSQSDLKATYAGRTLKVLDLSYSTKPRRISILLDVSGSMRAPEASSKETDPNKWRVATAAVRSLVRATSGSEISLMTFGRGIQDRVPLSLGGSLVLRWLDDHSNRTKDLKGSTELYDAILEANKQLEPHDQGDVIYVVTDGVDDASNASGTKVARTLEESATRLFAFLLKESHAVFQEDRYNALFRELSDLVFASGGSQAGFAASGEPLSFNQQYVYSDASVAEIESAGKTLNTEISSFYLLTVELPEDVTKHKRWKVELVDSMGKKRKDRTVTYPNELGPCATPSTSGP